MKNSNRYQSPYGYKVETKMRHGGHGRRPKGVEISSAFAEDFLDMHPAQKRSVSAYSGCDLNLIVGAAHGKRVSVEKKQAIEEAIRQTICGGLHPEVAQEENSEKHICKANEANHQKCSRVAAQKLADKLVSMAESGEIPARLIYWLAYECEWKLSRK